MVAITGLSYRGCALELSSPLQACAAGTPNAPRFQISYESQGITVLVRLPGGEKLQLLVRCGQSIEGHPCKPCRLSAEAQGL